MEKKEIRKQIREIKKQYTLEDKKRMSASVWQQVEHNEVFQRARVVLAYWSMDDEVFTHDFVCKWAEEKTILLPCVKGDELEIRYFDGREKLCPGEGYAIPEPVGRLFTDLNKIDVILVPGVAFDRTLNRLGRGKGFYDKILSQTKACKYLSLFDSFNRANTSTSTTICTCIRVNFIMISTHRNCSYRAFSFTCAA